MPIQNMLLSWSGADAPLQPRAVYRDTRPGDWLPMPTEGEIGGEELYLLLHIPARGTGLVAFSVDCTGEYTVALGRWEQGAFVQQSARQATGVYEGEVAAADFGHVTQEGFAQCLIRVTGSQMTRFAPAQHSKKTAPAFSNWSIVELAGRLPHAVSVSPGSSTADRALRKLRYFALYQSGLTSASYMFQNCQSLVAVTALDTSGVTQMNLMFHSCGSLRAIPALDTGRAENLSYCFYACGSLTAIPKLNTAKAANLSYLFYGCRSLNTIPQLDTSAATDTNSMFYGCSGLTRVPALNTARVTNMKAMFSNCSRLEEMPQFDTGAATNLSNVFANCSALTGVRPWNTAAATNMSGMFASCAAMPAAPALDTSKAANLSNLFSGCGGLQLVPPLNPASCTSITNAFNGCTSLARVTLTPGAVWAAPQAVSLQNASLMHGAIVDLLHSLPAIGVAKTLTLTGNPGVGELTQQEQAIATDKGWTLVL